MLVIAHNFRFRSIDVTIATNMPSVHSIDAAQAEHYTEENINFMMWFYRHAKASSDGDFASFQRALMVLVSKFGGPNVFEPDAVEAWNNHVADCDVACMIYGACQVLGEEYYHRANTECLRFLTQDAFFSNDEALVLGCMTYLADENTWFASVNEPRTVKEDIIEGICRMVKTIRSRGSHPEVDGTIFTVPPMFAVADAFLSAAINDDDDIAMIEDDHENPASAE